MSTLLLKLIEDVKTVLVDEDNGTMSIVFGFRQPARQNNQGLGGANRIVFVPTQSGRLGKLAPPKTAGGNPRPLRVHYEAFTVFIWAREPSSEAATYQALMDLFHATCRALYLSAGTFLEWGEPVIDLRNIELRNGLELQLPMTIRTDVLDLSLETVSGNLESENVLLGGTQDAPTETSDGVDVHTPE